jgi:hypothetical protein
MSSTYRQTRLGVPEHARAVSTEKLASSFLFIGLNTLPTKKKTLIKKRIKNGFVLCRPGLPRNVFKKTLFLFFVFVFVLVLFLVCFSLT